MPAADPPPPRLPDFFIVGHPKTGTTALYEMLRGHPEIFFARPKEPEYMASDMRRVGDSVVGGPVPRTLEAYLALFADAPSNQIAGEASAFYLTSQTAATEIAALNPSAKIIAIFREPASFLRSLHLQLLQDHLEDERDLGRALELEPLRREGGSIPRHCYRPQALRYSDHVRYTEQLARYHDAFGVERVRVLIYDDLRADNEATVRDVLGFLGVDSGGAVVPVEANPTVRLRSQVLDRTVHRVSVGRDPVGGALKSAMKFVLPQSARRALLSTVQTKVVTSPAPPPDSELMAGLRRRFAPEVERFGEYLGRDLLSLWGYAGAA